MSNVPSTRPTSEIVCGLSALTLDADFTDCMVGPIEDGDTPGASKNTLT